MNGAREVTAEGDVEFECPCGKRVHVGHEVGADPVPVILHEMPFCAGFLTLGALDYLKHARLEIVARRRGEVRCARLALAADRTLCTHCRAGAYDHSFPHLWLASPTADDGMDGGV